MLVSVVAAPQARFAAFALGCLLLMAALAATAAEKYDLVGRPAPDLVACNTCRAQLSALDRIAKTYASAGLTVIGVNLDDDLPRAEKFARAQAVNFQLLISAPENTGRDNRVDRVP